MSEGSLLTILVAIGGILAVVYIVTRLLPPPRNDCANGKWLQLGKDDESISDTLAGKSYFEYCTNAYYKDKDPQTIRAGLAQDHDGVYGCCSCYDPSSHRIVATGAKCDVDPTDDDCIEYLGQYGQAVPVKGAYFSPGGDFSNVKTSMLCGCQNKHGWGSLDVTQQCSIDAVSCKSDKDGRHICMHGNIADQPINDQVQYKQCCCPPNKGWEDNACKCSEPVLCIQSDLSNITPQSKTGQNDKIIPLQTGDVDSCSCPQEGYRTLNFAPGLKSDITDNVSIIQGPASYLRCAMTEESQQGCVEGAAFNGTQIDCQCQGCKGANKWSASKDGSSFHCCNGGTCPDAGLSACDETAWNKTPPPGITKQEWQSSYCKKLL